MMKISLFLYSLVLPIQSIEIQPDSVSIGSTLDNFLQFARSFIDIKNELSQSNINFESYLSNIDRRKKKIDHTQICEDKVNQYTGYITVGEDAHPHDLFYWFIESRNNPSTDPLILWLNGGPGCSSMVGNLMEIGACTFQHDNKTAKINEYSWNNNANLLFLDQPLGTGFSVSSKSDYVINSAQQASEHALQFLLQWYELYPQFKQNKFHIFGESYAGHYIPLISDLILEYNKDPKFGFKIPLISIGIGNGIVDYLTQFKYFPQIACNSEKGQLYNNTICEQMQRDWPECEARVRECHSTKDSQICFEANQFCFSKVGFPNNKKKFSHYDITKECNTPESCYSEIANIESWLNLNSTRELLGVKNTEFIPFKTCNTDLNMNFVFTGDNPKPSHYSVSKLLDNGVKVLIYAGDLDYICNYLGNRAWTLGLPWSGQSDFRKLKEEYWYNSKNGDLAGQVRQSDLLTYVRGFKGGHMYPSDQKENAFDLISRWLDNKSLIGK